MKVLTLWQPWASLVVHGFKKFETRPVATSYEGTYLIHAAQKWTGDQIALCTDEPFYSALSELGILDKPIDKLLPLGCIMGAVEITGCYNVTAPAAGLPNSWFKRSDGKTILINETEQAFGDYSPGRFVWEFKNHRALIDPIPYKGGQGYYCNLYADQDVLDIIQTSASYKTL
jgi:activating signal cointegrator 1